MNLTSMITSPRFTAVSIFIPIGSVGASVQIVEILRFCDFLLYCILHSRARTPVDPVDAFSRFMAHTKRLRPRTVRLGVVTM